MIKISPSSNPNICNANLTLDDFYNYYYMAHIHNYSSNTPFQMLNPAPYAITPQTMTSLISASNLNREEFRAIPANVTAEYRAHEEIHLQDGFTVERGAEFTAHIEPCANCESNRAVDVTADTEDEDTDETMQEMATGRGHPLEQSSTQSDIIYPNPTDGELSIGVDGEVQAIVIYNAMGHPIGGWKLRAISTDRITLDLSPLPTGTYIIRIQTNNGTTAKRLVVAR